MNNIEKFQPQRLSKKTLYSKIESIARQSNCLITRLDNTNDSMPFESYTIKIGDEEPLKVHIYAKNISGAGWSDKPEIKRIQIKKLPELPKQRKGDFYILCGICNYNAQDIVAAWDPMNYMTHNTCCSCYVFVSSLEKAVTGGLFYGLNKGKEVMTCSTHHFGELLKEISSRYY